MVLTSHDELGGSSIPVVVINHFEIMEEAQRWNYSPIYQVVRDHRQPGSDCRVFIVEGIIPQTPLE